MVAVASHLVVTEPADLERARRLALGDPEAVPAGAVLSEYSGGQYEINLDHVDDPLLASSVGISAPDGLPSACSARSRPFRAPERTWRTATPPRVLTGPGRARAATVA